MTRVTQRLCALLALISLVACGDDPIPVTPPTFNRPGAVAFLCYDQEARQVVPRSACLEGDAGENPNLRLTALVTQTAQGEIAAIDLQFGVALDADVRVPGFTHVRVGEIPSGIVVPPSEPGFTYVANFGSRTLQWIPSARFRPEAMVSDATGSFVGLPAAPLGLAMSDDEQYLFSSLPEEGAVLIAALDASGAISSVSQQALDGTHDAPRVTVGDGYGRTCPADVSLAEPPAVSAREDVALGDVAQPGNLVVDGDVLLVADESLPVIHRFAITGGTLTPLPALSPGVPVRDLVVSPEVPREQGGDELTRFLYAIDATDGSVLVMDYEEGSPTFGAALSVAVGGSAPDRLDLVGAARALSIITPGFPGEECSFDSDQERGPAVLRGAFLSVAMQSGALFVVDIYDLDSSCRGGAMCEDELVYQRRHRRRVGASAGFNTNVVGTPAFRFEGNPGRIGNDGVSSGDSPGLVQLSACPRGMKRVFPVVDGDPVICAVQDPWAVRAQRWLSVYEGALPGTSGGLGRFEGREFIAPRANFCARGVLGSANVQASELNAAEPEAGYAGDMLIITSDVPDDAPTGCEIFALDDSGTRADPIAIPIAVATGDTLTLGEPIGDRTLGQVVACFPELLGYEIRTQGVYTVVGSRTGFVHRVVEDPGSSACLVDRSGRPSVPACAADGTCGECGTDADCDSGSPICDAGRCVECTSARNVCDSACGENGRCIELRSGRAKVGEPFQSAELAFTIAPFSAPPALGVNSELEFDVGDTPASLALDVGSLPEAAQYSEEDQNLYIVDIHGDSLVQVALSPLTVAERFD